MTTLTATTPTSTAVPATPGAAATPGPAAAPGVASDAASGPVVDGHPTLPGLDTDPVARLLRWAVDTGGSAHLVGPHGIGKTAYVRAWAHRNGLRVVERSLSVCSPRDFCVPVPVPGADGRRHLEVLVLEQLLQADPDDRYVLVLDEFSRADRATANTAMELLQEHTVAGQPLPGLAAVVALDNPVEDGAYLGVGALDLAQADRVAHLRVDASDLPWLAFLAGRYDRDLTDLHRVWAALPATMRAVLCPRVLDHLLALVLRGLPAGWALPVLPTGRQQLVDDDGRDLTDEVLGQLVATIDRPGRPVPAEGRVEAAIAAAIADGWRLRLVGAPGIGKTSHVRAAVTASGHELEYLSLAHLSVSDLVVPLPMAGRLEFLPAARLVRADRRYVLVLDEFSRAPNGTAASAMELVNERTLAGRPLDGCVAVIALDNPAEIGGVHLDAGRIDVAQASRFTATIEVTEQDLPWRAVLTARYRDTARTFLDWRAEDLDDAARTLVSPRCLERMLSLHAAGLAVELGLPVLAGERVPVSVAALRRRLDGATNVGLSAVLADLDGHLDRLAAGDATTQLAVLTALSNADRTALEAALPAVARLLTALHANHRLTLFRQEPARRALWTRALTAPATDRHEDRS